MDSDANRLMSAAGCRGSPALSHGCRRCTCCCPAARRRAASPASWTRPTPALRSPSRWPSSTRCAAPPVLLHCLVSCCNQMRGMCLGRSLLSRLTKRIHPSQKVHKILKYYRCTVAYSVFRRQNLPEALWIPCRTSGRSGMADRRQGPASSAAPMCSCRSANTREQRQPSRTCAPHNWRAQSQDPT